VDLGCDVFDSRCEGCPEVQGIYSAADLRQPLCDVFDDELNRIATEVGSRGKAFKLVKHDKKLVRFFLPLEPNNPDDTVWSVIRTGKGTKRPPEMNISRSSGRN